MAKILNSKFYILFIILIIAAFLRLYNITQLPPGLYPDEAIYANNGIEAWETGNFKVFYPENNGREGLFINIQAIFLKFLMQLSGGNPEPWMLRLVSALFGILTVLGVYFLTKELLANLLSQKIALLSAFLMATSFWHINFSRIGFRAIMAPFFLTWGIYFILKSLNSILRTSDVKNIDNKNFSTSDVQKLKSPKSYILNSIFSGIFYGLGFYSYIAYRATPILVLVILLFYWFRNKNLILRTSDVQSINFGTSDVQKLIHKKFLLSIFYFLIFTIIVAAPLGSYFLHNPQDFFGRTTQISIFNSPTPLKDLSMNILKTAGMFNFIGDWNWRHNVAGRPLLFWPVGVLFLIGIILGITQFFKAPNHKHQITNNNQNPNDQNSKPFGILNFGNWNLFGIWNLRFGIFILFIWLIIAALPVVISNEGIPHALRSILMAPAVFILAGIGGLWLYEFIKSRISMLKTSDVPSIDNNNFRTSEVQKLKRIKRKMLNIFVFIFLSLLVFEAYNTYFILWGQNPNVYGAFNADYVQIGRQLNNLPKELPKYVVVEATGVDVRGIPMPAQTVMFITDTFAPEKQKEKNIYYVLPNQKDQIPENSYVVVLK